MPRVLYVVTVDVAPASEQDWNDWHSEHHIPQLMELPGFLGVRKYREPRPLTDGWLRYVTFYELADQESLDRYQAGEDARRLRAEHQERFGDVTRVARKVLHEVRSFPERDPYEGI
jgi:antibiotic biosynthesis monooxygenase (ABM) superfamily enzyme